MIDIYQSHLSFLMKVIMLLLSANILWISFANILFLSFCIGSGFFRSFDNFFRKSFSLIFPVLILYIYLDNIGPTTFLSRAYNLEIFLKKASLILYFIITQPKSRRIYFILDIGISKIKPFSKYQSPYLSDNDPYYHVLYVYTVQNENQHQEIQTNNLIYCR